MSITTRQYESLQAEACRMAGELPRTQLLASLIATYEAGRRLALTKSTLLCLLGSVVMHCIDAEVDEAAPPIPPAAGLWPRVITAAAYAESGALQLGGIDDNDRPWRESLTGRSPEAWLLKQLYVERKFGRRSKRYNLKQKTPQSPPPGRNVLPRSADVLVCPFRKARRVARITTRLVLLLTALAQ